MSYGVKTVRVHKKLVLDKRKNSENWYARLSLDNGQRIVRSTKTDNLDDAKERALKLYYETKARIDNELPAQTRKFKHVAEYAIQRMQAELDAKAGKQAYKDYISALRRWLIPYFGAKDIEKVDLAALTAFDQWRTKKNQKPFSQSGINNHNAALNRVLDEAELRGWIVKSLRPTLLNKGTRSESRGSFTDEEYRKIHIRLRKWHTKTQNKKAMATREVLRNYVLFLANTGIRHGTEALGVQWRNIEWHKQGEERYLVVNVDGKTSKRSVVARDKLEKYLWRQSQLNTILKYDNFDALIAARSEAFVFTDRLGNVATIYNLNRAFNALLESLDLKIGADGKTRTLYSLRHFYATRDLKRGVSTHALSRQLGNSTTMIDAHYSKYSPLINAELHSARYRRKEEPVAQTTQANNVAQTAFEMLATGSIGSDELLAALGVERANYSVTDDVVMLALKAREKGLIDAEALLRVLNG